MKYLPWLMAGVLGYLFVQRGGRGVRATENAPIDGLTGEPMPQYKMGRPRQYLPSLVGAKGGLEETKRVGVMRRALMKELENVQTHMWKPSNLRIFAREVRSELNTQLNNQIVCVGTMGREEDDSGVVCDGTQMSFAKWMAGESKKKREAEKRRTG